MQWQMKSECVGLVGSKYVIEGVWGFGDHGSRKF